MKKITTILFLFIPFVCFSQTTMLADITEEVITDFATYTPYQVEIQPDASQYEIEDDFSNVSNFQDFNFTQSQKEKLLENYFVVIPGREGGYSGYKEIYDIYTEARVNNVPQFVTGDAMLHTFHKLYDKILKNAEEEFFVSFLVSMDSVLFNEVNNYYNNSQDEFQKECFKKLVAYFSVPLAILDEDFIIPDSVADVVNQELTYIDNHTGYLTSPIFEIYSEDYSQYKPRGHYTESDTLKKYFKAMMWHGRQTFVLDSTHSSLTGAALTLIHLMENLQDDKNVWTYWNNIYIPTVFFVGKADDILPQDYLSFAKEYYGDDFADQTLENFLVEEDINRFITAAKDHFPDPQITTETPKGMRFMGQRFIPDSYILDQLVYNNVFNRYMPKSLDILAVMNSQESYNILDTMGETSYGGYIDQLEYLKDLYQNYPNAQWAENLYWNWLYCLMPLLIEKENGYPPFMKNLAWLRKDINTALGSWTELRHDTILYAKQSATTTGDWHPKSGLIQGYVEPNPYLFARLASLTKFMNDGLSGLNLLNNVMKDRLIVMEEILLNLKTISEKELTGEKITMDEYKLICSIGEYLTYLVNFDANEISDSGSEAEVPVIADVHTDPNTLTCLEEGVGYPFRIFVICKIEDELKITVGGIFSYYEFIHPIANRLTDEEWKTILKSDSPPILPFWTSEFFDVNSSLNNTEPDYVYTCKQGVAYYPIYLEDTTCTIGDSVDILINVTKSRMDYVRLTVKIENCGLDSFYVNMSDNGNNKISGSFSTAGMDVGNVHILLQDDLGSHYVKLFQIMGTDNISETDILPDEFKLHQNYPNPFNPVTNIRFDLPKESKISLIAYDIMGNKVWEYENNGQLINAGKYEIQWNGKTTDNKQLASGVYLIQLRTAKFVDVRKVVLLK